MPWPTTYDGVCLHSIYVNGALAYNTGDWIYSDAIANLGLILGVDYTALP
jgi:hypothetical protein